MDEQVAQPFENVLAREPLGNVDRQAFAQSITDKSIFCLSTTRRRGEKAQKLSCGAQGRPDAACRNGRVEFRISEEPLQPSVFILKVLQPLRLVDPKPTELLLPSVKGCSVTPIFFHASSTVLPLLAFTSTSRLFSTAPGVSPGLVPLERAAAERLAPAARAIRPVGDRARSKFLRVASHRLAIAATLRGERAGSKRPRLSGRAVRPARDRAAAKLLRVARDSLAVAAPLRCDRPRAKRACLTARAIRTVGDGPRPKLGGRARPGRRHA